MPGGLLNLVSYGNLNVILNGNPSKTFFKTTYAKYTNFGLQKFRIEFEGLRTLRLTEDSHFTFNIPRYADLFMDTYFVITLPTIWSPILSVDGYDVSYSAYEFKWIENLGSQLIRKVRFMIGSQLIYEFTGQYLYNMVQRDFSEGKKKLFNEMTGNVPELNDPANYMDRNNIYPNAYLDSSWNSAQTTSGPQPSIPGKTLYIPFNIWSTLSSKLAIPLVSLQYNMMHIEVDCRPIQELFVVRDLNNPTTPIYIQANQNDLKYQFYRFLHPPPNTTLLGLNTDGYTNKRTDWYANIHLLSTYAFLSEDEVRVFAAKPQNYLIKEVYEENFYNITGNQKTRINSIGLVSSWMWFYQRSDVKLRNEWSNYTNWDYSNKLPNYPDISLANSNQLYYNNPYSSQNQRDILISWGLLFDGKVRENTFDVGVLNYVEKYVRTAGNAPSGLYCYNFCLTTDPFQYQPSGAVNLSKFNNIEFEYTTYIPQLDPSAQTFTICDASGDIIGINKPVWRIYDYNYNLYVMEERYNILTFESGQAGLMYAR
jgi:hypothetical protein